MENLDKFYQAYKDLMKKSNEEIEEDGGAECGERGIKLYDEFFPVYTEIKNRSTETTEYHYAEGIRESILHLMFGSYEQGYSEELYYSAWNHLWRQELLKVDFNKK